MQSRREEEDDLAREDWEEDVRQHRHAAQQAQESADRCSGKIIDLLYHMALGSARQVGIPSPLRGCFFYLGRSMEWMTQ